MVAVVGSIARGGNWFSPFSGHSNFNWCPKASGEIYHYNRYIYTHIYFMMRQYNGSLDFEQSEEGQYEACHWQDPISMSQIFVIHEMFVCN